MELWLCKKMSIFRRFMPKYLRVMYHNVKTQIIQLKKVCVWRETDRQKGESKGGKMLTRMNLGEGHTFLTFL